MTGAYYNEIDPKAAAWLRELISKGHIAPGEVDERSIVDIVPAELRGFTQCHFFAGIGVWSYALRAAGWPDDRRIWTGSCPCQPFSQAGKGGGTDDERHLWPAWEHLIRELRPSVIFGEQVASKAADSWADLVQDDLEALDYAFGAVPFPAASVGAPHIRDRLYWLAVADAAERRPNAAGGHLGHGADTGRAEGAGYAQGRGSAERLADDHDAGRVEHTQRHCESQAGLEAGQPGSAAGGGGELGDAGGAGSRRNAGAVPSAEGGTERGLRSELDIALAAGGLGDHHHSGLEGRGLPAGERRGECSPWAASDFVWCRDGKWRPVEPGSFPLAHGAPARVGRLRGYGNAIVSEAAKIFIEASGLV